MKKIFTYTALCLMAILLMPSCKSKMGVTKRHYMKGYYVSHTKAKTNTPIAKTKTKQIEADKIASINVLNVKTKENSLKDQVVIQPKESIMASAYPKKGMNTYSENKTSYKSITITQPFKELKQAVSKVGTGQHEGHGHSLFWIIILILLILWILGFLSASFGSLIHLLLIIALILFILWLLRVV